MRLRLTLSVFLFFAIAIPTSAQLSVAEPFKVGTFEIEGIPAIIATAVVDRRSLIACAASWPT